MKTVMVGNKCDVDEKKRQVSYREGEKVCGRPVNIAFILPILNQLITY